MNNNPIKLIFATLGVLAIGGCSTTSNDWHSDFVQSINEDGNNPYIRDPVLQNLERRIRNITRGTTPLVPPYDRVFNPRNQAILDNFKNEYDHAAMMRDINLTRDGFAATVAAYYPTLASETGCDITDHSAYFKNIDTEPKRFTWQFVQGACVDGIAHGIGEAKAAESEARFVGRFEHGVMTEGAFTMVRQGGTRVIQVGGVPRANHTARLLSTELQKNGHLRFDYGDFNNQGALDGFGLHVYKLTQHMVVTDIGHFANGELNGFGAKQRLFNYEGGRFHAVWLGSYQNHLLNGPGAWTNGLDKLVVGQWKNGEQNGIGYQETVFHFGDYSHKFLAGNFVSGKKHGWFTVRSRGLIRVGEGQEYREQYDHGRWIADDRENIDIDFGQLTALAAGAAVIGSADIEGASKAAIAGAFMTDVMSDGSTGQMRSLQRSADAELERSRANANASTRTGAQQAETSTTLTTSIPAATASTTSAESQGAADRKTPTNQIPGGASSTQAQAQATSTASNTKAASASPSSGGTGTTATQAQLPAQPPPKPSQPKANQYVGSGRDYPFTGTSGTFFKRDAAVDLAKLSLRNQAAEFCGSSLKAELIWSPDPVCKESKSGNGEFLCTIDALVNCYQNLCEERFCGTEY